MIDELQVTRERLEEEVLENPFDLFPKLVLADFMEENYPERGPQDAARANRFPMSKKTAQLIVALKECRFAPATWHKRFARDLPTCDQVPTTAIERSLSPKQFCWLVVLLHRYRKSNHYVATEVFAAKYYERYCTLLDVATSPITKRKYMPNWDDAPLLWD